MRDTAVRQFQHCVRQAVKRQYKTLYKLGQAGQLAKPTISAWLRKKRPRVPCSDALLRFARVTNTSLNWLLLGVGPEQLGGFVSQPDPGDVLRHYVRLNVERYLDHEAMIDREIAEEVVALLKAGVTTIPKPPNRPRRR